MVDYSRYKKLKVEKKEKVAIVTINIPDTLNAVTRELHLELEDIWEDLDRDDEINAVILTGAGRAFSSGGNLKWIQSMANDPSIRFQGSKMKKLIVGLVSLRKPIVAAVNGDCIGLGASIALHCDIVIAAENARFGDPHVAIGLVAGDGGCLIWDQLIGMAKAKKYLLTGDLIKAPEAERIGLISSVVPAEKLMEEAWKTAKRFADGPTQAVAWTKMCLNKVLLERINLLFDTTIACEMLSQYTADHAEAVGAFLEKRAPKFKGGEI